jgi:cytochrome c oxidase assembly factor CtaG
MSKFKFSITTLAILVLSSFVPVLQVLLLTANGAFVSLFISADDKIILIVNGVGSLLMLVLFYLSKSTLAKVLSIIGVLLFFVPFLFYATENSISTEKFYFLQFLIIGVVTGIILAAIEAFKRRAAH